MLFVAEYEFGWEMLEAVVAKRIEWGEAQAEGFRFVGEYVWQDHDPPFRGVAIIDADDVEPLNAFVLHYGPTLKIRLHPATDVASGIGMVGGGTSRPRARGAKKSKRR
jgi:hypothetical protein